LATALCFFFAAFPALLVIKPPKPPLRRLVLFGPFMFIGHLGFPFSTVYAGLTSLILSVHAFITIALAILFLGERPSVFQLIWAGLA